MSEMSLVAGLERRKEDYGRRYQQLVHDPSGK